MMVDLATHQGDLAADQLREQALAAASLVRQHAERCLKAVGEIADMGARALDQRFIVLEQRVELGAGGSISRESRPRGVRSRRADGAERAAQAAQGLEAEANLPQHCADNADEQDAQRRGSRR